MVTITPPDCVSVYLSATVLVRWGLLRAEMRQNAFAVEAPLEEHSETLGRFGKGKDMERENMGDEKEKKSRTRPRKRKKSSQGGPV